MTNIPTWGTYIITFLPFLTLVAKFFIILYTLSLAVSLFVPAIKAISVKFAFVVQTFPTLMLEQYGLNCPL